MADTALQSPPHADAIHSGSFSAEKQMNVSDTYVTFELSRQSFAVSVRYVREILSLQPLTFIPDPPRWVEGLIDLRGVAVPVVDLAGKLGLSQPLSGESARLIVCERHDGVRGSGIVAVTVDRVMEVTQMGSDEVEPLPTFEQNFGANFVSGLSRMPSSSGTAMTVLLDLGEVLRAD